MVNDCTRSSCCCCWFICHVSMLLSSLVGSLKRSSLPLILLLWSIFMGWNELVVSNMKNGLEVENIVSWSGGFAPKSGFKKSSRVSPYPNCKWWSVLVVVGGSGGGGADGFRIFFLIHEFQ